MVLNHARSQTAYIQIAGNHAIRRVWIHRLGKAIDEGRVIGPRQNRLVGTDILFAHRVDIQDWRPAPTIHNATRHFFATFGGIVPNMHRTVPRPIASTRSPLVSAIVENVVRWGGAIDFALLVVGSDFRAFRRIEGERQVLAIVFVERWAYGVLFVRFDCSEANRGDAFLEDMVVIESDSMRAIVIQSQ